MSKKHRPWQQSSPEPAGLRTRVERAMAEGRWQHAVELARELNRTQPGPQHRELLHTVYLGRGHQQRSQGQVREAVVTLQADMQSPGFQPAWREASLKEIGLCGDLHALMLEFNREPDPAVRERWLPMVADAAVQDHRRAAELLPEALRPDFQRVRQAFTQVEQGQDDAARESLQGVGLRSPFAEWKLALRGLQAYYQKDDARALDNWQRLDPERFPYRLVAPLRLHIDASFRDAQPPAAQVLLRRQAERLQPEPLAGRLRELQATLTQENGLNRGLRQLEGLLPTLRAQTPELLPRLTTALYYMLLSAGQPEDIPRFRRVLGAPPDDPSFNRIQALGWERAGDLAEAHLFWQKYEAEVAQLPQVFPGEQANRARALIWERMGENAASVPETSQLADLPPFLRNHPDRPRPLKPTAEQCYRRAIELAPERRHTHRALFQYHFDHQHTAKALKAGTELLERFPDDVDALRQLAVLQGNTGNHELALPLLQRALGQNPLDRRLRKEVGLAHLKASRVQVEAGRFDEARANYQAALTFGDALDAGTVYCDWAACEFKAGNESRAEELLAEGRKTLPEPVVAFSLLIETIRLKLGANLKRRFDKQWAEGLKQPPDAEVAVELASLAGTYADTEVKYTGQKTHQKKVLDYLKAAQSVSFSERQFERLLVNLQAMKSVRLFQSYVALAQNRYPHNPAFWLIPALAEFESGPTRARYWVIEPLVREAEAKLRALPHDPRRDELLAQVDLIREGLDRLNPFARLFGSMGGFDPFFGDLDPED